MREFEELRNADDGDGRRKRSDAGGANDAGGVAREAGGSGVERMVVKQRLGREEKRDHYEPGREPPKHLQRQFLSRNRRRRAA